MLRILLLLLAVVVMTVSLAHILLGPAVVVPGGAPVNATTDSEDRFYATFFLAYGAAVFWAARDIPARVREIRLLMLIFFAGGIARIISIIAMGWPHPLFVGLGAAELILPPIIIWLASRIGEDNAATPEREM